MELESGDGYVDLVSAATGDGGGVAFYVGGFRVLAGKLDFPARIDWSIYGSQTGVDPDDTSLCVSDDEPAAEGSTWFPDPQSVIRSGLLFEVSGRRTSQWFLRGTLVANAGVRIAGSIAVGFITQNSAAGGLYAVLAGPLIG